jgi:hypothetical protein
MTLPHVADLHFEGRREAAKKRLQKLKAAGLLGERPRRAYEPGIIELNRRALRLLSQQGILAGYPSLSLSALEKRARVSDKTIRHELEVMDVKAAFHRAAASRPSLAIAEFGTWPLLYQFDAKSGGTEGPVQPDGFVRIREAGEDGSLAEHTFFVELDRSTQTQDKLAAKAGSYLHYYKSGGFALRNGADRDAFRDYPFRVLVIVQNAERRNNTAARLLGHHPPILSQVLLATRDEVMADAFGPIWIRPLDYRDAVKGTAFDLSGGYSRTPYKSNPRRDEFVVARIARWPLLD